MASIGTLTISDVQNELEGMLHGTTLDSITDIYGVFNRAARRVLGDVDPQETKVVKQFGKIYYGVWNYALDIDVKGNKIVDIFPQANRTSRDDFKQVYNKAFDLTKEYSLVPDFTPRYSSGIRTIRINAPYLDQGIQIDDANGYNTNGTWVAGSNVSSIATNTQYTTDGGSGSVSFTIDQTGTNPTTATLSNSTLGSVDLTNYYNNGDLFFAVYLPNAAGITSLTVSFGSSSSAYYTKTGITTDQMGNAFVNGWNFIKVAWSGMTTVGTPDYTAITYLSFSVVYNGTLQTQVLLNQFWIRQGTIFNYEYYSKYLFRDSSGTFKEQVTADTDLVNLDTDGINLFIFAALGFAAQQQQGLDALFFDAGQAEQLYQDALAKYRGQYKSEVTKPQGNYYPLPARGYRRYFGRFPN